MVSAYGTIANDGNYMEPLLVTRLENKDGDMLAQFESAVERALSVSATHKLVDVVRDVINRGTGTTIRTRSSTFAAMWRARQARRRTTRAAGSS